MKKSSVQSRRKLWPHELRVIEIFMLAGCDVNLIEESSLHTADVIIDGVEYEIKSPKSFVSNSLEHLIKEALKQAPNIIIDTSRIKYVSDNNIKKFLIKQAKSRRGIKRLIMVTKKGEIVLKLKQIVNTPAFDKIVI